VHAVEIDIMQPINPDIAPKVHVPALNHVGLWIGEYCSSSRTNLINLIAIQT
jgi:hypothetical protein